MATISFPQELFDQLTQHLGKAAESVAFMRCSTPSEDGAFLVRSLHLVADNAITIGEDGECELDDDVRREVIMWATETEECLVEAHSHGLLFRPARFSRFDLAQLSTWVPHVRWRLRGRPYAALVTASLDFDGLAWIGPEAESVDTVTVDGRDAITTTGLSIKYIERSHDD